MNLSPERHGARDYDMGRASAFAPCPGGDCRIPGQQMRASWGDRRGPKRLIQVGPGGCGHPGEPEAAVCATAAVAVAYACTAWSFPRRPCRDRAALHDLLVELCGLGECMTRIQRHQHRRVVIHPRALDQQHRNRTQAQQLPVREAQQSWPRAWCGRVALGDDEAHLHHARSTRTSSSPSATRAGASRQDCWASRTGSCCA